MKHLSRRIAALVMSAVVFAGVLITVKSGPEKDSSGGLTSGNAS